MRQALLLVIATLFALALTSAPVLAHEEDGAGGTDGYDDHHMDHMMMGWEDATLLELIGAYLVLAIPIGLLVYLDAREKGMNASMWFVSVLVPFFGMAATVAYLMVREERRIVPHSYPRPSSSPPSPPPPPPPPRYGGWDPQYDPWDHREEK